MLMRALSVHIAHETSGAARTRHSLRPLTIEGEEIPAELGRIVPRERECVFAVIARSTCDEAIHSYFVARWIASLRSQ